MKSQYFFFLFEHLGFTRKYISFLNYLIISWCNMETYTLSSSTTSRLLSSVINCVLTPVCQLLNLITATGPQIGQSWRRIDGNVNEQSSCQPWYLPTYEGNENEMENKDNITQAVICTLRADSKTCAWLRTAWWQAHVSFRAWAAISSEHQKQNSSPLPLTFHLYSGNLGLCPYILSERLWRCLLEFHISRLSLKCTITISCLQIIAQTLLLTFAFSFVLSKPTFALWCVHLDTVCRSSRIRGVKLAFNDLWKGGGRFLSDRAVEFE